jgi:hypothetical protein
MAIRMHFVEAVRVTARPSTIDNSIIVRIAMVDAHDGSETVVQLSPDGPGIDLLSQIIQQATAARDALAAPPALAAAE